MNCKTIFFDWDGVITDSVSIKASAFAALYREYGAEVESMVVDYHLRHGGISRFEKIKYFHKNFLDKDIDESEVMTLAAKFSGIVFDAIVRSEFVPGALETIRKEYDKGTLLFVVTGTPTEEMKEIAVSKNVSQYFTEIHGSPSLKKDIIKQLLNKYSLSPTECLMIGDALEDYHAAVGNRVPFLGIAVNPSNAKTIFPAGTVVQSEVFL